MSEPLRHQARDLTVASLLTIVSTLPVFLVGTLALELRGSLHFGNASLGLAITLYYLGAAAAAIPLGRLADHIGAIRVMRAAAAAGGVLLLLLAGATRSWASLATLMVICGIVSAGIGTATNLFLARRVRANQGLAFGIKQSAVPFASLLGGLAVPAVALTIGWRWAFALGAVVAVIAGLLVPAPRTSLAARRDQLRANPPPPLTVLPLVLLAAGLGLGQFAASAIAAFLVTSAVAIGITQGSAGLIAALASMAALVVRIGVGYRADKRGRAHFPVVAAMLLISTVGYVLLAVGSGTGSRWAFICGAVVALGIGWGWNGLFNFAVVRTHLHAPARATGITQVGARVGGVIGPFVVGVLADRASYTVAWIVAGCALFAAAAAVLTGRRLLRASRRSVPESALAATGELGR